MQKKIHILSLLLISVLVVAALTAVDAQAASTNTSPDIKELSQKDPATLTPEEKKKLEKHEKLTSEFESFANSWVRDLNQNHQQGISRMTVTVENGVYKARYHRIEIKSSYIRESRSKPGFYSGILRYNDLVYESVGQTEEECRNGNFSPVVGSAQGYREIFQLKNNSWKP